MELQVLKALKDKADKLVKGVMRDRGVQTDRLDLRDPLVSLAHLEREEILVQLDSQEVLAQLGVQALVVTLDRLGRKDRQDQLVQGETQVPLVLVVHLETRELRDLLVPPDLLDQLEQEGMWELQEKREQGAMQERLDHLDRMGSRVNLVQLGLVDKLDLEVLPVQEGTMELEEAMARQEFKEGLVQLVHLVSLDPKVKEVLTVSLEAQEVQDYQDQLEPEVTLAHEVTLVPEGHREPEEILVALGQMAR